MMAQDGYDDGLVHGHGWATEPARPARPGRRGEPHEAAAQGRAAPTAEAHDDGLVHDHAWASAERGRPAIFVLPAE